METNKRKELRAVKPRIQTSQTCGQFTLSTDSCTFSLLFDKCIFCIFSVQFCKKCLILPFKLILFHFLPGEGPPDVLINIFHQLNMRCILLLVLELLMNDEYINNILIRYCCQKIQYGQRINESKCNTEYFMRSVKGTV